MKTIMILAALLAATLKSPDGRLAVSVEDSKYSVSLDGRQILEPSPLGLVADYGEMTKFALDGEVRTREIAEDYTLDRIKASEIKYRANEMVLPMAAGELKFDLVFRVSNRDVAFRYELKQPNSKAHSGKVGCVRVMDEKTGFSFPEGTTQFTCPQSDAMISWKRSKPSYEEEYVTDKKVGETKGKYGKGWTFPCLFREMSESGDVWVLVSETGNDANYCGCRLGEVEGRTFKIEFPMAEENNGNGTREPAFALPGATPWRTITVGSLKDIVETTVAWDVVKPKYEPSKKYEYGRSSWSWIVWQDDSMNWEDQIKFVDLAAAMGYEFILVDAGWDKELGKRGEIRDERGDDHSIEALIEYAKSKGVDVFLWYSSSGWWNDIEQSPINVMCDPIARKRDMRWMAKLGVKGIKVDFWGGDKQETFRLYEQVLSDADDAGLMVIFHGCTIPRGWERMYPNYVGSEAVLASENQIFSEHFRKESARNASLHPFIRNSLGCMEFGGTFLNKGLRRDNNPEKKRRFSTDWFECATAIIFQNPVQNFALTPNNLKDAPKECIDFMKAVPTTWDETRFIEGYPGKYVVLARRHGDKWYIAGVTADKRTIKLDFAGLNETIELDKRDGFVRVVTK